MVDKVNLSKDEVLMIDTATNIVTFAYVFGNVEIINGDGTVFATLNDYYDIYTVPANSGTYKLKGLSEYSAVYIFRSFYI
ncbi:MAG: hypothetical protein ACK4NU_13165 [Brevundimonas sp.]